MKFKPHILQIILYTFWLQNLTGQESVTLKDVIMGKAEAVASQEITMSDGFTASEGCDFRAYINSSAAGNTVTPAKTVIVSADGTLTSGNNYIRTITLREPVTEISLSERKTEEVRYFDGVGELNQIINVQASPSGKDIITPFYCDDFGPDKLKFLPYAAKTYHRGAFRPGAADSCGLFYKSGTTGRVADDWPLTITTYYGDEPVSEVGPGLDWQPGVQKQFHYPTNASAINSWYVDGSARTYPANSLLATEITDENGHITREYKNNIGQVVLKESVNGTEVLRTHYIYDDYGLLRIVIPPMALSPTDTGLCYYYTYDTKKRLITKQIPGAQPVEMIYDNRDRLVLVQDGNMKHETVYQYRQYRFFKYDKYNREIMTGAIRLGSSSISPEDLREAFRNHTGVMYETYDGSSTSFGYTLNNSFPSQLAVAANDILTVTWYDNYRFLSDLSLNSNLNYTSHTIPSGFNSTNSELTIGRVTGSMAKVPGVIGSGLTVANRKLYNVNYYDDDGNVIRSIKANHKGGYDVSSARYEPITFQVLQTEQKHIMPGKSDLTITKTYTYDHVGRLLETDCKINDSEPVALSVLRYNDLGEMVQKYLHSTELTGTNRSFVQKVDYSYNIRGWLTGINSSALGDNDLFGMNLHYCDRNGLSSYIVNQCNGNISAMTWNTDGNIRGFGYYYDDLNRLIEANYAEGPYVSENYGKHGEKFKYDKNGNIQELIRRYNNATADSMTYAYEYYSNKLTKINDKIDLPGISDYVSRSTALYSYDYNGNMTFDAGKNTTIRYNTLNLPECITFSNGGKLFYHYDALGNKVAQTVESSSSSVDKTTDYIGETVYENSQLSFLSTEEGRVIPIQDGSTTRWKYEYFLKDHLGNTRVIFSGSPGSPELLQETNYYPFGLVYENKNYNTSAINYPNNKYLYNGKELQADGFGGVSLDWYDYGARFYDPQIGRWHVMDPLAQKYYSLSSYAYCANNPIKFIDPDGKKIVDANGNVIYTQSGGWSQNAPLDARRIAGAMLKTETGRQGWNNLVNSPAAIQLKISQETIVQSKTNPNTGKTEPGYLLGQAKDQLASVSSDFKTTLHSATIVIYEGSINQYINNTKKSNDPKAQAYQKNTINNDERIGAVASHEETHLRPENVQDNYDNKYWGHNYDLEAAPNEVEIKVLKETGENRPLKPIESREPKPLKIPIQ